MQDVKGFSLIELLVTMTLVTLLASMAYPSFQSQFAKSLMTEARIVLERWAMAQEKSRLLTGQYVSLAQLQAEVPLNDRLSQSFSANQVLSEDGLSFQLTLSPRDESRLIRKLSLNHWGQLQASYQW